MSAISVFFEKDKYTISHNKSGTKIITDTPIEYGGNGFSFSSTDLLAASLTNCIFTSIDKILVREGISKEDLRINVDKKLLQNPKRLESISLVIISPILLNDVQKKKVTNAINVCPVYKCLKDGTNIIINFEQAKK